MVGKSSEKKKDCVSSWWVKESCDGFPMTKFTENFSLVKFCWHYLGLGLGDENLSHWSYITADTGGGHQKPCINSLAHFKKKNF